jgi:hypothetical protein
MNIVALNRFTPNRPTDHEGGLFRQLNTLPQLAGRKRPVRRPAETAIRPVRYSPL